MRSVIKNFMVAHCFWIASITIFSNCSFCIAQYNDPRLYPVTNEKFLIVWQSDLNNNQYTGQFLQSDGELEGNNFPIKSNELIAFKTVSDFMVTKTKNYPGSEYFNSSFKVEAWMYHSLFDTTESFILTRQEWPFCGTGFLGFEELLFGLNQRYIYVFQFDGQLGSKIFDNSGSKIADIQGSNISYNITSDGLSDDSFLVIWFGGYSDNQNNSQSAGIYATLFDQNQVAADTILIERFSNFPEYIRDASRSDAPKLEIKALTDTTYSLFVLEPDSMLLSCYVLDRKAEVQKKTKTAIPILYNYSSAQTPEINIFNLSNLVDNSLSLFISTYTHDYPDRHITNYLYHFAEDDDVFFEPVLDTTQHFKEDCFRFKIGSNEFVNPAKVNNEIQIEYFENFTLKESKTIATINHLETDEDNPSPAKFYLSQNYPNPFNPITTINYELPIMNFVELRIYNLLGQKIVTLISERQQAGKYQVKWDATGFPGGVYYCQIKAGEFVDMKKMVLLR